jgi:KDO2-lipid IV(A) lauroyltransferase
MNYFFAILFIIFIAIVGILPFFLLYVFSSVVGFLVSRVIQYRRSVVEDNIRRSSIPEMNSKEFNKLVNNIYKNLTDVLIEGLKGFTLPTKTLLKRHKVLNPEIIDPYYEKGQSIIGVLGHYNNWEWGSLSAAKQLKHNIVALYKPLSNKWIDRYAIKIRARYGTTLASIYETSKTFEQNVNHRTIFLLVADQSPSNERTAYWIDFLGRNTAFLRGPERHAKKNNLPVFFVDIQRIKRGYYEVEFSLLAENPSTLEDGEITRRYAKKLEEQIQKNPSNWLWTHRRWKLTKD